ncbi:hypothetical protein ABTD84_20280, partial [Acinetobacter baumannii]
TAAGPVPLPCSNQVQTKPILPILMSFDPKKSLPKAGVRFQPPAVHGSADAYLLAQAALALKAEGRMLAVVVAGATDAQRLLAEI